MISKLCWLSFILIMQTPCLLSMYKHNRITQMQINKIILATHIRNFHHHVTYKTPQNIVICEHWDGSETRTYPDGKTIHIFPSDVIKKNPNLKNPTFIESFKQKWLHRK